MNFSGFGQNTLLGRIARLPLRIIPHSQVIPILQGKLKGKRWIAGSGNHGCWLGSYEYVKVALFEKYLRPGGIVFDVGANVGYYTLLSSLGVGPSGRVFSFEPSPRSLSFLKRHLELNLIANVDVLEVAVADKSRKGKFEEGPSLSMGRIAETGEVEVQMVSLDDLYLSKRVPLPDVIKMDIEGAEYDALRGARIILEEGISTIFLATHGRDVHDSCCRLLCDAGYEVRPLSGGKVEETDEIIATKKGSG
jgi:FkbM family methyltransferase